MIPTPHIEVKEQGVIAKTVLMPGDPLRAKFIADTFLTDVIQFNLVRNMFGYTGKYKGKEISVMGSGMGMPSIGIYSYELFNFYGVERIIRIGSCGAYSKDLNLYDLILVKDAYSESSYAKTMGVSKKSVLKSSTKLNSKIKSSAKKLEIPLIEGRIHSSDVFYHMGTNPFETLRDKKGCLAVEMESFALFANAMATGKEAACILTVSDSLATNAKTTSEERQKSFTKMMELALSLAKLK